MQIQSFPKVWIGDFEYSCPPGERPEVVCLVAKELWSGKRIRLWQDEIYTLEEAPYTTDSSTLFVCFYAIAEMRSHLVLNWTMPTNILDLFAEFRNLTNGLFSHNKTGLLVACSWFGIPTISAAEKDSMHKLALRGGPWTKQEKDILMEYCETDVLVTEKLLHKIIPTIDLPLSLIRGRYMRSAARIMHTGIPIDTELLSEFTTNRELILARLIEVVDVNYRVFEGISFRMKRFKLWLKRKKIAWPYLESNTDRLKLDAETFKDMVYLNPSLKNLYELRKTLSTMREMRLSVGADSRNRYSLSAFGSITGRYQPSSTKAILGSSPWVRSLIKPNPGTAIAYVDWSQHEFGIAAVLSGDENMLTAYQSGDPYLEFAKQAGAIPYSATKETHREIRNHFKECSIAVLYGMQAKSLAKKIGKSKSFAQELLDSHRRTYSNFWRWSDNIEYAAFLHSRICSVFGWQLIITPRTKPLTVRNFPMQANGAEMLKLACCFITEAGIQVCAPLHDAIMIEASLGAIEETTILTQKLMADASAIVLNGFRLRTESEIVRYPDRYVDKRSGDTWQNVMEILQKIKKR